MVQQQISVFSEASIINGNRVRPKVTEGKIPNLTLVAITFSKTSGLMVNIVED